MGTNVRSKLIDSPAAWRYGTPAIALHWAIAALIVFMAALGWWMESQDPSPREYVLLHKSVGLIVAVLVLLRVLWRVMHRPAPLPPQVSPWMEQLADVTHWLLYGFMLLVPLTGIAGALYSRSGLAFFGIHIPSPFTANREMAHNLFELHGKLVWGLVVLVALHAIAGFKHLLVDHNRVFERMWPRRRPATRLR